MKTKDNVRYLIRSEADSNGNIMVFGEFGQRYDAKAFLEHNVKTLCERTKDNGSPITVLYERIKNGKLDGAQVGYYRGRMESKVRYKEGKLHGRCEYYEGGKLSRVGAYRNGLMHGRQIHYYPDGSIQDAVMYQYDKIHGRFVTYHDNGVKEFQASYKNGKMEGISRAWYSDGKLRYELHMKHNVREGEGTYYDRESNKTICVFKNDKCVQSSKV